MAFFSERIMSLTMRNEPIFVSKQIDDNADYMREVVGARISFDLDFRELMVLKRGVQRYYVNGLVDDVTILHIIKMLVATNDNEVEISRADEIIENRLIEGQVERENKLGNTTDQLLSGLIAVFIDGERHAYIVDVRQYPGRQPGEPDTERVIRGSRDGFTENVIESTALIRRRIKD